MIPTRIQRRRVKGWRMPENTTYVGRGSKWGNPYKVTEDNNVVAPDGQLIIVGYKHDAHKVAVDLYHKIIAGEMESLEYYQKIDEIRAELKGKNLACWCAEGLPCHADLLIEIANS